MHLFLFTKHTFCCYEFLQACTLNNGSYCAQWLLESSAQACILNNGSYYVQWLLESSARACTLNNDTYHAQCLLEFSVQACTLNNGTYYAQRLLESSAHVWIKNGRLIGSLHDYITYNQPRLPMVSSKQFLHTFPLGKADSCCCSLALHMLYTVYGHQIK